MTREEAKSCIGTIEMLQRLAYNIHGVMDVIDADNCKKIIKALEQEPCEDAISRQAVIDMTGLSEWFDSSDSYIEFVFALSKLPPVTHTEKVGHWINNHNGTFECDKCGCKHSKSKWCPNCGSKMRGGDAE